MTALASAELRSASELTAVTAGAGLVAALLAIGSHWFAEVTWTIGALALAEILVARSRERRADLRGSSPRDVRTFAPTLLLLGAGMLADLVLAPLTSLASISLAGGIVAALYLPGAPSAWGGGFP
ncbi:MAG: hypothetical protein L3K03_03135 [Thermoplasmata archaeon]|nr:hypothetical protein [Thermoplasmata archaeon]